MSTAVSMWLGILFLLLAITAVLLQAWLWGPAFWNDEKKKTEAPRSWLRVHAVVGYAYFAIYVWMMWHMVPRLWQYQYELPARTVVHAVAAITIGVILVTKLSIVWKFRHFEEAMPRLGFGLLLCTVILSFLSIPFSLRAVDVGGRTAEPQNIARTQRVLGDMDLAGVPEGEVFSTRGFETGREVLVTRCTPCHDMRTILLKPRTGADWHRVVERMLDKPNPYGQDLLPEHIPYVTAYLVAITPDLQESTKRRRKQQREKKERMEVMSTAREVVAAEVTTTDEVAAGDEPETKKLEAAPGLDDAAAAKLMKKECTDCHELDEIDNHGGDDAKGWAAVLEEMVEEGAEIGEKDAEALVRWLAGKHPKR